MDAYLAIAEKVIREARIPLSAREILKRAYPAGNVPQHLHGRTQHKTLGARLAEDILASGDKSIFFRNAPGRFFLTTFLHDPTVPIEYRRRFIARRRRRQLAQSLPLTLHSNDLPRGLDSQVIPINRVLELLSSGRYYYPRSTKHVIPGDFVVWSFVIVSKGSMILTYRHGHYREQREKFANQRAIGFFAPVLEGDRTLFDLEDHGIVKRGLTTISIDLGLTTSVDLATQGDQLANLNSFVQCNDSWLPALLSVIRFDSPDWFEPYARRLAINDLRWVDISSWQFDQTGLDPWSTAVWQSIFGGFLSQDAHVG